MLRLFGIIYALAGPTVAGVLFIVALSMGMVDARTLVLAALIGFVAALPVTWVVAKKIAEI